jgi:CelD/BcsL family acetyltransferase involved in cellulose biosynthesis
MDVELVTTAEALSALQPEWLDLWRRTPDATPFQSPMWLLPWWRHFGSDDLSVITLRRDDGLVALAPLYVVREDDESLGLLLGTGNSDYLDMLGDADVMQSLAEIDCQMWDLQQLRPSSPLLRSAAPPGWNNEVQDHDPCFVLSLEHHAPSTHFRKKLRYYHRSLERLGALSFIDGCENNLDTLMDALFALHAARWERRGMPGMLADDVTQRFHRDAARAMLDAGTLRMYAMRVGERMVAVFYGFASQATVYYYLSGYHPDLEKLSPGTVIVAHAIEEAVREGATTFDFLRGAEEYKYAWGAKERMNSRRQLIRA